MVQQNWFINDSSRQNSVEQDPRANPEADSLVQ